MNSDVNMEIETSQSDSSIDESVEIKKSNTKEKSSPSTRSETDESDSSDKRKRDRHRSSRRKKSRRRSRSSHSRKRSHRRRRSNSPHRRRRRHSGSRRRHHHSRRYERRNRRSSRNSSDSSSSDYERHRDYTNHRKYKDSSSKDSLLRFPPTVDPVKAAKLAAERAAELSRGATNNVNRQHDIYAANEIAKATIPKFYNPASVNAIKMAEQQEKRKLLWSKKPAEEKGDPKKAMWESTSLVASKGDANAAAKFRKLMGIHSDPCKDEEDVDTAQVQGAQKNLFRDLEREYEMSRMQTHTQRGAGLGFSSSANADYSAYMYAQNKHPTSEK